MHILFLASEVEGFVKTGGLADVARALPEQLAAKGHQVRVCLPYYQKISTHFRQSPYVDVSFKLNHQDQFGARVYEVNRGNVSYLLFEHLDFFQRDGVYDDGYQDFDDNPLRFAFFAKATLEWAMKSKFQPDIVHCNDWQTALAPFYLKEHYRHEAFFEHCRSLLTIHNGAYQGKAHAKWLHGCGIHPQFFAPHQFEDNGDINNVKGGLYFADGVNAVSQGYAQELTEEGTDHSLREYFIAKKERFIGITNGCDYGTWDPSCDQAIAACFESNDLSGKQECKQDIQQELGLPINSDAPLIANISRLAGQKGHETLIPALIAILKHYPNCQFILLGSGEAHIALQLEQMADEFPNQVRFIYGYDEAMAHRIEAGADIFVMPSIFEPCGLNQMYSMRYGTLPVVRATGGLKDTVIGYQGHNVNQATGFKFLDVDSKQCQLAIVEAVELYIDQPSRFKQMQINAMNHRFNWHEAANHYERFYELLNRLPVIRVDQNNL